MSSGKFEDLSNLSMLDLFRLEADNQVAILTSGLLELAQSSFHGNLVYEQVGVDELVHNSLQVVWNVYPTCPVKLDLSLRPEISRGQVHLGG